MSARRGRVIVPLRPGSDGDVSHRPTGQTYRQLNPPTLYLEKIGMQWMNDRNEALPGISYALERLPAGYTLWERPRQKEPSHFDKYLYGHPGHTPFDSPNRFFAHFKYLMENGGNNIGCPCTVCNAKGGTVPSLRASQGSQKHSVNREFGTSTRKATAPQYKGRPKLVTPGMDSSRIDEEGTPDVYRNLIDKLQKHGTLDEAITEPLSMDWRAEQEILPETFKELQVNPQWLPRRGDIVLYVRELPADVEICRDNKTGEFKLLDISTRSWRSQIWWEAGLVGQTPAEETDIEDLVGEPAKQKLKNISYSGVRVEPIPYPNSTDKSLSKRHRYVPINHTRPFIFWKDLCGHIPEEMWHPTIKNALTAMSSFSLMGKYHFRGTWPEAQIYCRGIYIGSEMIVVGDTVRLIPKSSAASTSSSCTDILTIKSIRLKLTNLNIANSNDYDEGRPYNSSVQIFGTAYTSDASRSSEGWPLPEKLHKREPWRYPLHPPDKEMQVPFSRILGRLFESDAMTLWFPPLTPSSDMSPRLEPPNLSQGLEGLLEARNFSRENDRRITDMLGANWFWGDSRAEALDLRTVNGLEISKFDDERDPKEWRKYIKAQEGQMMAGVGEERDLSSVQRSLRGFAAPPVPIASHARQQDASLPFRKQSEGLHISGSGTDSSMEMTSANSRPGTGNGSRSDTESGVASNSQPGTASRKRAKVIDLSSDEEDEILQHTNIVVEKDGEKEGRKKTRVMVVID
ncbi:hypothetical protein K504DRAFT_424265 [Pleomassaria siparia CBS 279.74]|uniref:Cryptic loci regulator 2 N-terminal domain-containing protein n=1 Tax=Pleomassaria siparia CBS 279.74 TaxID=1314801 RepID=A0A6G1KLY2_9PLEO|nr:hypothetical protein K504DRAFT_424265 [Pleomassaria siparia CBS 279.74]